MKKKLAILAVVAVFYAVYILLFLFKFDFNPSATVEFSHQGVAWYEGQLPRGLVVQTGTEGYDGQRYYLMALDPSLKKAWVGRFFYQRIFYPALAAGISFGNPAFLPWVLLGINYAAILSSCAVLLAILEKEKADLCLVYLWAFQVGLLVCVLRDLTEPLMMLLVILSFFLMREKKHVAATACLALALLTKELALVFYVAALLFFAVEKEVKKFFIYALAVLPFCIWQGILFLKTTHVPILEALMHLNYGGQGFAIGVVDYLWRMPGYIAQDVIAPIGEQAIFSREYIRPIYQTLSPALIVLFLAIQVGMAATVVIKKRRLSLESVVIFLQAGLLSLLPEHVFSRGELFSLGRFCMILFLFSMIFYVRNYNEYNRRQAGLSVALAVLSVIMAGLYGVEKIIFFQPIYYLT